MLTYPTIDPVAFSLGPLHVHWYGLMYLAAFLTAWLLARYRSRQPASIWSAAQVDDIMFYGALGVIVGGRVGSILFYGFGEFSRDPLSALRIWEGGMSFHGGFIGVMVALWLYARSLGRTFFQVMDFVAPIVPPGLFYGRIGNFINGELWGHPTDLPWGMAVRGLDGTIAVLHPSQLYEAALEGLALFALLWWFSARPRPRSAVSALFLIGYGLARFLVEFVRMPDRHIGYLAWDWLTMGQVLSLPMLAIGLLMLLLAYRRT